MKRFSRLVLCAGIGAVIGGGVAGLLTLLIYGLDSRFIYVALRNLGIAGMIGGMLCILLFSISRKNVAGVVIAGLCGGGIGCLLMIIGSILYAGNPWPSPRPYPGYELTVEAGGGSGMAARIGEYTARLSIEEIKEYYGVQMPRYCVDEWQFSSVAWCEDESCLEATCKIRRLWLDQYFEVTLFPISDQETRVRHINSWED